MKEYRVPFAFEMYGRISVVAETEEKAKELAQQKLDAMTVGDMLDISTFLEDSEEIDDDGVIVEGCEYKSIVEAINNNFDNPDLKEPAPGVYDIQFYNTDTDKDDETEFDLDTDEGLEALMDLWLDFAKENRIHPDCVEAVSKEVRE